jgi:hypothetical protein
LQTVFEITIIIFFIIFPKVVVALLVSLVACMPVSDEPSDTAVASAKTEETDMQTSEYCTTL